MILPKNIASAGQPDNYRPIKSAASIADFKRSGAGKLLVLDILL